MNHLKNLISVSVLIVILLTCGCMLNAEALQSTPAAVISTTAIPSQAMVRGLINYPVLAIFIPQALVTVQLVDISNSASHAVVLEELHIRSTGRPAPFQFEISYDPSTITPDGTYALVVSVTVDGKLMYRSSNKLSMGLQASKQPVNVTLSAVGTLITFDEALVEGRLARYSN